LARHADVVDEPPATGDKALIFDAPNRLPDSEFVHVTVPRLPE